MFIRLSLFQKVLQINCNRFNQTAKTRCWSKSNTTNFTGNIDRAGGATMFFIIEEAKEIVLDFSKGTAKVLWFFFVSKDINIKWLNITL